MSGVPAPVVGGTFLFLLVAGVFTAFNTWLRHTRRLDKDAAQIFCVSIVVGTLCLWIMWLCAWLHQWHP